MGVIGESWCCGLIRRRKARLLCNARFRPKADDEEISTSGHPSARAIHGVVMVGKTTKKMLWLSALCLALCVAAGAAWAWGWVVVTRGPMIDTTNDSKVNSIPGASSSTQFVPQHFLPAFGGELAGSDYGEFGGHLIYRTPDGSSDFVLDTNIRALVQLPFGVAVATGLDHLNVTVGSIYEVQRQPDGLLRTALLGKLPGAPSNFRWTTRGDLVFDVVVRPFFPRTHIFPSYECFVLTKTGRVRRNLCALVFDGG